MSRTGGFSGTAKVRGNLPAHPHLLMVLKLDFVCDSKAHATGLPRLTVQK